MKIKKELALKPKYYIARLRFILRTTILFIGMTASVMFLVTSFAQYKLENYLKPWNFSNPTAEIQAVAPHETSPEVRSETQDDASSVELKTIKQVALEEQIDWKLLWAICMVESHCHATTIGDHGDSWGAFQLNKPAHPTLTQDQAFNIAWSAKWTAQHGKKYADNPALFAKAHNGLYKTTNQWYVDRFMEVYKTL